MPNSTCCENNRESARHRLLAILEKDHSNLEALVGLAGLALGEGRRDESLKYLKRAVETNPQSARAHVLLAQFYLQNQQLNSALETARKARQIGASDPQAMEVMGDVQLALGDVNGAISNFSALTKAIPSSAWAHLKLAMAYTVGGDSRSADTLIKKIIELAPGQVEVQAALGDLYLRNKRYAEAINLAQQLQRRHGDLVQGYVLEGDAHWARENYAAAAQSYQKALAKQRTGRLIIRLHEAQVRAKMPSDDGLMQDWLKANPSDIEVRGHLARFYLDSGARSEAIAQYKILLQLDPQNVVALNSLAWVLQDESAKQAMQYAEQAFQLKPDDAAVVDTLGWLLVKNNQLERGTKLLQEATILDPDSLEIRFHLAKALFEARESDRARIELEKILHSKRPFAEREEARSLLAKLPK